MPGDLPVGGFTIDMVKFFGKSNVNSQERAVAKAACRAMNLVLVGSNQHQYWEEAIRAQVPDEEYDSEPIAGALINGAVDRASNAISAAQFGPRAASLYYSACYLKKLG